jgi:diacylglycerol kinase family enzyme
VKIFFLLNPSRPDRMWDLRDSAGQAAKRFGWTAHFGQVDRSRPHSMDDVLGRAFGDDFRRLVIVGGDGTLHRAVNIIQKRKRLAKTEFGIVPAGTCNDFARALKLETQELAPAFQTACREPARPVDLGRAGDALFVNNAGFGRRLQPTSKRRIGPWETLRSFTPIPLKVRWDKGSIEGNFFMALVCNAPYFSGGLHFSTAPSMDDGQLDVFLVPELPKWRLALLLGLGKTGRALQHRKVIALKAPYIEFESGAPMWPQADGEPSPKAVRSVTFSVDPEKAMIVAPH